MVKGTVFHILGTLLIFLSVIMFVPLCTSLFTSNAPLLSMHSPLISFLAAISLSFAIGFALRYFFKKDMDSLGLREGFAIVTLSWILIALFGSLPLYFSGTATFVDSYFETMSGFTTTGASIFKTIETIPASLLLWRSMTQWIGGMGIIILTVAIFPEMRIGGYHLFKAEVPGGATFERIKPRISDTAKTLWKVYVVFTLIEIFLLLIGKMSFFDAICHAFTTMSTGGFSTRTASVGAYQSGYLHFVIVLFMVISGTNFGINYMIIKGHYRKAWNNAEFRFYLGLLLTATIITFIVLFYTYDKTFLQTLNDAVFQVVSITTTTGFATADYNQWPSVLRLLFICLMFVGGCTGSTGGSVKVIRILIITKLLFREMHKLIQPRAVLPIKVGGKTIDKDILSNILAFTCMFLFIFIFASLIMAWIGLPVTEAVSSVAATLGNIGPGLGAVGPTGNFSEISIFGKWVLICCMLLGRLEIYSVIILLYPLTWKES